MRLKFIAAQGAFGSIEARTLPCAAGLMGQADSGMASAAVAPEASIGT